MYVYCSLLEFIISNNTALQRNQYLAVAEDDEYSIFFTQHDVAHNQIHCLQTQFMPQSIP